MKRNRILILASVIIVAMAIPIVLLQVTGERPVSAEAETQLWGDHHVGFVINTTSGMQPEINRINGAWEQIGPSGWCLTCTYHLTQFRDVAQYVGSTQSEAQVGTWLADLNAAGGGDCPDNTFAGLREFALNVPDDAAPVSDALVFSDSPPMGNRRAFGFILDKLVENGVRVHNVGSPLCDNENLPLYAMNYLSLLSGGEFYLPAGPAEYMTDTMIAMNSAMAKDLVATFMGEVNESVNVYPLDIDSSISTIAGVDHHWWCLTCTRSSADPAAATVSLIGDVSVELIDPDGNVIDEDTSGYLRLSTSTRDMQIMFETLTPDQYGMWKVRVSGIGEYAINVFANSSVHMKSLGRNVARANKPFDVRAVIAADGATGIPSALSVTNVETITMSLIGVEHVETIPVNMSNTGMPPSVYGGSVTVPTPGLYRLMAEGVFQDGTKFTRVDPTPIRVRTNDMSGSGNAPALPGSTRTLTFELVNDGTPERSTSTTFDLELFSELGWTTSDSIPETVTLGPGESVQFTAMVTVPDDAEIGTLEDSTLVAVPQDNLAATASSSAGTLVVEELQLFLPSVLR